MARSVKGKGGKLPKSMQRADRRDDGGPQSSRWWLVKDERGTADSLWAWIERLKLRQKSETLLDLVHEAIYEGRPLGSTAEWPAMAHLRSSKSAPAYMNVTRNIVDTVTSKLGKRRPMPVISADDAGYSEKLFAKRASRVLRRKLGSSEIEKMTPQVLRDMIIRGTGVMKVYNDGCDVQVERVPRHEIVIDPREARYGEPRTMAHVKLIAADVLKEKFPKYADEIDRVGRDRYDDWSSFDYDSPSDPDMVQVVEAWHLPTEDMPGRRVIAIRGCQLLSEQWDRPRFPIVMGYWSRPPSGVWGHGLVEDLAGMQAYINNEFRDLQEAFYWASSMKLFVPRGANINKHHLRARHPAIIETDGAMPQPMAPNPVSQQRMAFFEQTIERMFEIAGVSQLSASSKSPLGPDASGKAIETMYDIESDRFAMVELEYAWARVDLGRAILDEARAMSADPDRDSDDDLAPWISEIDWKKLEIDGGSYRLIMEPINFLPDARSGRLDGIQELAKAGLVTDPMMVLDAFDEPDMARMYKTVLGPRHAIARITEQLADVDADLPVVDPNVPADDLTKQVIAEYCDVYANGREDDPDREDVLQRHRDYLQLLKAKKDESQAAMPGPAPSTTPMQAAVPGPAGPMGPAGPSGMPPVPGMPPMPTGMAA